MWDVGLWIADCGLWIWVSYPGTRHLGNGYLVTWVPARMNINLTFSTRVSGQVGLGCGMSDCGLRIGVSYPGTRHLVTWVLGHLGTWALGHLPD